MVKRYWMAWLTSLLLFAGYAGGDENPVVEMHTTAGLVVIELDKENAPISVQNFLNYDFCRRICEKFETLLIPSFILFWDNQIHHSKRFDKKNTICNQFFNIFNNENFRTNMSNSLLKKLKI